MKIFNSVHKLKKIDCLMNMKENYPQQQTINKNCLKSNLKQLKKMHK